MDATRVWRLEGVVRPYGWGSTTAIPELLGRAPTGEPQAELWLGAHPGAPSQVAADGAAEAGVGLDTWIRSDPEAVLGVSCAARFDAELPFLLKLLAAEQPLSIQAHPNREQARAGFARENAAGLPLDAPNRCYRDPNHKPELICALTRFRALNRFRAPEEIVERSDALGVRELSALLAPLREAPDREGLAAFFAAWTTLPLERREPVLLQVVAAAKARSGEDPVHAELLRLARAYPSDPGVLAPLFLNLVELSPGEAMYLPAGELHSYLGGTGVELMANSDNVLRGGLTGKHVDVPELLATLSFASGPVERLRPEPAGAVESSYATPAAEFSLSVLRPSPERGWRAPRSGAVRSCCAPRGGLASPTPPVVRSSSREAPAPSRPRRRVPTRSRAKPRCTAPPSRFPVSRAPRA